MAKRWATRSKKEDEETMSLGRMRREGEIWRAYGDGAVQQGAADIAADVPLGAAAAATVATAAVATAAAAAAGAGETAGVSVAGRPPGITG